MLLLLLARPRRASRCSVVSDSSSPTLARSGVATNAIRSVCSDAPGALKGAFIRTQCPKLPEASSSSSTGLAICGLGAAVGAAIAAPKKEHRTMK